MDCTHLHSSFFASSCISNGGMDGDNDIGEMHDIGMDGNNDGLSNRWQCYSCGCQHGGKSDDGGRQQ